MSSNDSVVNALLQAVDATPGDIDLRLHLASLLLQGERPTEALEHYAAVLSSDPVNIVALEGARDSALRLGDARRSEAYATLLDGLAPQKAKVDRVSDDRTSAADQREERPTTRRPELRVVGGTADSDTDDEAADDRITLADVAGLEAVKKRIDMAFLGPLRNPEGSGFPGSRNLRNYESAANTELIAGTGIDPVARARRLPPGFPATVPA